MNDHPIEIERKYLVDVEAFLAAGLAREGRGYQQGYLLAGDSGKDEMRVRLIDDQQAFITLKGQGDLARTEHEFSVDLDWARRMLGTCGGAVLEKTRYRVPAGGGLVFEVDFYGGALEGLVVAEIELPAEDTPFDKPAWLGQEITFDPRYKNAALATKGLPIGELSRRKPGV